MKVNVLLIALTMFGCSEVVTFELSQELKNELKSKDMVGDQLLTIYENYQHTLDRNNSLLGPDLDANGVRDDLDAFIEALQIDENKRGSVRQIARVFQQILSEDYSGAHERPLVVVNRLGEMHMRALACAIKVNLNPDDMVAVNRTIKSLTMNTKSRAHKYIGYNIASDGSISRVKDPNGEVCD
ncbi:hypothetical protein [Vibrio sp. SCSIO 43136]|uniref:hypothetical protein n=1 Tax=Vibrio sp. SCSIO 43136 TaxID=2819101 RepID=UPI002075297A|nr:hypothetical protein [Vibrio sp. SCSIO 43136]USD67448.1 hypothetical protein J4N39_22745 [Vibrio sp. SCSIO 43136]